MGIHCQVKYKLHEDVTWTKKIRKLGNETTRKPENKDDYYFLFKNYGGSRSGFFWMKIKINEGFYIDQTPRIWCAEIYTYVRVSLHHLRRPEIIIYIQLTITTTSWR